MAQGFYELLSVDRGASLDDVRLAYQRQLAGLVRRVRAAQRHAADVSVLEATERELKEAMEILTDPVRRRRYDAFLRAVDTGLPEDAESLWELARPGLIDPAAAAALEVVRALTDLPMGDGLPMAESAIAVLPDLRPTSPVSAVSAVSQVSPPVVALEDEEPELDMDLDDPTWELFDRDMVSTERVTLDRGRGDRATSERGPSARVVVTNAAPSPPARPKDPLVALEERFGFDGRFLRGVRELRGQSIEDLARATRISQRYLEAIEENGYDRLPAGTFVRGYVRSVARLLDLDEATVTEGFMALFTHHRG